MMKITYAQYINNPLGEKSSVVTNRGMYQKLYREKLDKILLREGGKVKYTLYKSKENYYIHFKIPSEVVEKFYYDTVIEFYTDDGLKQKSSSLKDYYVKFYSNDPAFVYTFGHAFIHNKIFIEDLLPKMSKEAIKDVAKVKNPKNLVGYVKSLFFAYLLIGDYGLFAKSIYDKSGESYNKNKLIKEVEHASKKIEARKQEGEKQQKKKRREKNNEERFSGKNIVNKINPIKNVKTTKKVSSIGRTKTIKSTKKI